MLSYNKLKISEPDYIFILCVFILLIAGLTAIYSASFQLDKGDMQSNFYRQLTWVAIGLVFMIVVYLVPSRTLYSTAYLFYGISILLLILTLFSNGDGKVSRWLSVAGIQFQPAEIAKIGTLLALARYLAQNRRNLENVKEIGVSFGIVLAPFLLIIKQPDLGTSLVFLAMALPLLYWAGLSAFKIFIITAPILVLFASFNFYSFFLLMIIIASVLFYQKKSLVVSLLLFVINISVGIATPLLWNQLRDYQKHRILTFLGMEIDPYGLSYQVIQSKVAIGSGGFLGKGILNGTQTQLRFLPAQHTDFVFSVIGEELGFLGSFIIICLFFFLLLRGIYIASIIKNRFLSLITIGTVVVLGFHVIVNIGMTIGIMPVTGLPLPLLSYGGSFTIVSLALIGIILHTSARRYV